MNPTEFVGTIDEFIQDLRDPDPEVRIEAAWALSEMGEAARPALHALIQALHDEDGKVVLYVCDALKNIGKDSHEAVSALKSLAASSQDRGTIAQAQDTLLALEAPEAYKNKFRRVKQITVIVAFCILGLFAILLTLIIRFFIAHLNG